MKHARKVISILCPVLVALCIPVALAQNQSAAPNSPSAAPKAPALNPEQRRAFAQADQLARQDTQYSAAVQKVIEAQKAADNIYFAKLRKLAPELGPYIDFLVKARNPAPPVQ